MRKNILTLIVSFMFVVSFGNCKRGVLPPKDDELRIAPQILSSQLKNGFSYFLLSNKIPEKRCSLLLNVNVGSFNEKDHELGMAHFVEHCAFHDISVSKDISLVEWFQKHAMAFGPDANAFTSYDNTVYKIDLPHCDEKNLGDALLVLRSFSDGLNFAEESIKKEQNVIDAEERETQSVQRKMQQKIHDHIFSGTLYPRRPVLGTSKTRGAFTKDMLTKFYDTWYHPKNLTLVLVGDIEKSRTAQAIANVFSSLPEKTPVASAPAVGKPDHKTPIFAVANSELAHIETIFAIESPVVSPQVFRKNLLKERLAYDLALTMVRNAFISASQASVSSLRPPQIFGALIDHGIYEFEMNVAGKKETYEANFKEAYARLVGLAIYGFSDVDFAKAREFMLSDIDRWVREEASWSSQQWAHRILAYVQKTAYANNASDYQYWVRPLLLDLTKQDCQNALREAMSANNQFFYAVGPIKEDKKMVAHLTKLLSQAKALTPTKPHETKEIAFQYHVPDCKKINLKRDYHPDIYAYSVDIAKDFRLVIKKTNFMKDNVVFELSTDEGFLTMERKDFLRSSMAQRVLPMGGLEKHPPEEITEITKGKFFSINTQMTMSQTKATGSAQIGSFPFALEYLSAFVDHPGYAESMVQRNKQLASIYYQQQQHNLWKPILEDFPKALLNNDPRIAEPSLPELLSLNREELLSWHNQFISKKPLQLVVVGDVDIDQVIHKVLCVFGHRKAHASEQKMSPAPLRLQSGIHKKYSVLSKELKSNIAIRYPLMMGDKNIHHNLPILRNVIQEKLRLKLREKRQITYIPHATLIDYKRPFLQSFLQIEISPPTEDAEKTRQDVQTILDKLSHKGISADDLEKAKAPYRAHLLDERHNNYAWLGILSDYFYGVGDIHWLKSIDSDLKAVTKDTINALLRQYFAYDKASSAIVIPTTQSKNGI